MSRGFVFPDWCNSETKAGGSFMRDWMRDQADLFTREGDPQLELPAFDFPAPHNKGSVQ